MERLNHGKKEQLSYLVAIIFILSGSIFDVVDVFLNVDFDTWTDIHCMLKDFQALGFALLCFTLCPYSKLKIKALTFMLIIWRTLVTILNVIGSPTCVLIVLLYAIYLIFLYRIYRIKDWSPSFLDETTFDLTETNKAYNVLLPVGTFRGLLQILFTFGSPKYETRLLVMGGDIYSVRNNRYHCQKYNKQIIKDLMRKAGARVRLVGYPDFDTKLRINKMIGKRTFTGVRDCRKLEL